ncbi:hypothetical protein ACS0PU_009414 [Formica fusca]
MLTNMKNIERNICVNQTYAKIKRVCKSGETVEREKRKEKEVVSDWTGRIARKKTCEKRNLLYVGISKFRCETKKGIGGYRRRDEMHQACGSGFVRPPLCLSFSALHRACSSYFYRLWQFPRRTL